MRFDGVSRTELIARIAQLEGELAATSLSLLIALREGKQYLETLTAAQERGTALQLELQSLKSSPVALPNTSGKW
jgi:hypothetical protein